MSENQNRVLIMDESDSAPKSLISGLSQAGFSVAYIPSFMQTPSALQVFHPDIIILTHKSDVSLEICLLLHTEYHVPIVLVGNDYSPDIWEKALVSAGADFYVQEPFDIDELVARIKAILRRYRKNEAKIQIVSSYN